MNIYSMIFGHTRDYSWSFFPEGFLSKLKLPYGYQNKIMENCCHETMRELRICVRKIVVI
jgi:hypothetical protein